LCRIALSGSTPDEEDPPHGGRFDRPGTLQVGRQGPRPAGHDRHGARHQAARSGQEGRHRRPDPAAGRCRRGPTGRGRPDEGRRLRRRRSVEGTRFDGGSFQRRGERRRGLPLPSGPGRRRTRQRPIGRQRITAAGRPGTGRWSAQRRGSGQRRQPDQGRAAQGRAAQGRSGQGRPAQGRSGQGRAGERRRRRQR